MFIRNYKEHERTKLSEWLSETDDPSDCSYLTSFNTFILEDDEEIGFFTIKYEHELPSLRHFYIKKNRRSHKNARKLVRSYIKLIKDMGYDQSIIAVKTDKMKKFVQYFFKKKPYAFKEGLYFYLVEV